MGGSTSSKVTGDGDFDNRSTKQNNFGLINVANESLDSSSFNFFEVTTFILIGLGILYYLKLWCKDSPRPGKQNRY